MSAKSGSENGSDGTPVEPLLGAHLDYLRLRNQRPRSIRERLLTVRRAAKLLGHPVADATPEELEIWQMVYLAELAPASMHNAIVHVAQFLKWCVKSGYRVDDPSHALVRPQHLNQRLPKPMGGADIARAMATADQPLSAWIALGAFCGLRCMEIAALAREDVIDGVDVPFLRIVGKGGKERIVALPLSVLAELRDAGMPQRGHLWTRLDGKPGPPSATRVSERINKHLFEQGCTGTAHWLRHRFGTELYAATKDPFLVATVMGHSSTDTTMGYVRLNPSRISGIDRADIDHRRAACLSQAHDYLTTEGDSMTSTESGVPAGAVPIPDAAHAANEPPLTDCPEWCSGHGELEGWDVRTGDDYTNVMTHIQEHGGASACQDERRPVGATESTFGEPYIWAAGEEMPIEKAEKLAADMTRAIVAAREIAGAQ